MPLSWNRRRNDTIKNLKRLFTEPISNKILKLPILWGRHTFSENTISNLQVFTKNNCLFVKHPYTREPFQLTSHIVLPENLIVQDLSLIFLYCSAMRITKQQIHDMFVYFINSLLIQQRKANNIGYIKIVNNVIQDLLLNEIVNLFNCAKPVLKILTATKISQISTYYKKYKPSDEHLNGILFRAIKQNNSRVIDLILSKNIKFDHNLKDKQGKTALHWNCYHNNHKLTKILLKKKADPSASDFKGITPIRLAEENNNIKMVILLKKYNNITNQSCLFSYNYLTSNANNAKSKYNLSGIKKEHANLRNRIN